jgi:hypothetical protein
MRTMLLRQGEVQILLSNGSGTQEFLDVHGDGIADIALACDDVGATRKAAVASGARTVGDVAGCPVVSGFGSVRHTLLPVAQTSGPKTASGPLLGLIGAAGATGWPDTVARPCCSVPRRRHTGGLHELLRGGLRSVPLLVGVCDFRRSGDGSNRRPQRVGPCYLHPHRARPEEQASQIDAFLDATTAPACSI